MPYFCPRVLRILKDPAAALRRPLVAWYRESHRRLPWRATRDPYAIWVSEIMLQQTRTETVLRYYRRFLERFPTVRDLAVAPESRVLALWSGLGYYSRARNLRRAARVVVEKYGGRLPRSVELLRALPGVGRYTAAAIASIAFDARTPVLDGNVARVFARLFDVRGELRSPAVQTRMWSLGEFLVPRTRPGEWNQALMELGAAVCTPRRPQCPLCPVRNACAAYTLGRVELLPTRARRTPPQHARRAVGVIEHDGRYLLLRADRGTLFRGLWEFPGVPVEGKGRGDLPLRHELRRLGFNGVELQHVETIHHSILDRKVETTVFRVRGRGTRREPPDGARWFTLRALRALPLSSVGLKILRGLGNRATE